MLQLSSGQHFGENKKRITLKNAILIEAGYVPDINVPWHYHENAYFYYHVKGHLAEINKKNNYYCIPGTALFHHWQEPHRNGKFSKDALFYHLEFKKEWFETHDINVSKLQGDFHLEAPQYSQIFRKIHSESKIQDSAVQLSIDGLSLQAFSMMLRSTLQTASRTPEWVKKLREILRASPLDNPSLAFLANEVGTHPVNLSRNFAKYFGMPLGEYIRQIRMDKSIHLLESTDMSITEIAFACGFSDQSHYIRLFKNSQGTTPFVYRKNRR